MTSTIEDLEARLRSLYAERDACVREVTMEPGRGADVLRDNYHREQARRSGLRGIDQAIAGVEASLSQHRRMSQT